MFCINFLPLFLNFYHLINKNNLGVAKSRNKAKKFIKGKFTAFLDADDIWKKKQLIIDQNSSF